MEKTCDCVPPLDYPGLCEDCGEKTAIARILRNNFHNDTPLGDRDIARTAIIRNTIATRKPWNMMRGVDRAARVKHVMDYLVSEGVLEIMTLKQALELGEVSVGRDGVYCQLIDFKEFAAWSCPVTPAFPPDGWQVHPHNPAYYYKGQEVLTEAQLRELVGA